MTSAVLAQPTLVLNRSWLAIDTTSVMDALRLLYAGAAKAVKPDTYEMHTFESWADLAIEPGEPFIKTVALRIPVPEVVVLTRYDGIPAHTVAFTRRNLFRRDGNRCQYCGCRPGTSELTIDHVVPRAHGGQSSWENCVLACVACNRRKADRTPRQAHMTMLTEPKAPRWSPTMAIPVGRVRRSWQQFISERYWNTPLEP